MTQYYKKIECDLSLLLIWDGWRKRTSYILYCFSQSVSISISFHFLHIFSNLSCYKIRFNLSFAKKIRSKVLSMNLQQNPFIELFQLSRKLYIINQKFLEISHHKLLVETFILIINPIQLLFIIKKMKKIKQVNNIKIVVIIIINSKVFIKKICK